MTTSPAPALDPVIEPVAADDPATMDGWLALQVRAHAHDEPELPPPCPLAHARRFSWPGFTQRAWVVRGGPDVVAAAHVVLPERDNRHFGFAHVLVDARHRRRGLGTRLLDHVVDEARAAGRTRLVFGVGRPVQAPGPGPGAAFLAGTGARLGMAETRRRLVLPPPDPAALSALAAAVQDAARDYRLVQWVGPTPAQWRDDLAVLIGRMSTDAPMGELTMEPRHWDADRVQERDAAARANGLLTVTTAARASDGHVVAYTQTNNCALRDGIAEQTDTLVAPAHRGRRLGLWIKLANLELLVREHPEVRAIDTFNADDNRWMIAVNEAMGFVPLWRIGDWELDLATWRARPPAPASAGPASR